MSKRSNVKRFARACWLRFAFFVAGVLATIGLHQVAVNWLDDTTR